MCSQAVPLHQNVKDLIGHILPPLLEMYESEDDKYVFYQLLLASQSVSLGVRP